MVVFQLNPYMLGYYAIVPGMVSDLLFIVSPPLFESRPSYGAAVLAPANPDRRDCRRSPVYGPKNFAKSETLR